MKNSNTRGNRSIRRAAWLMLAVAPVAAIFSAPAASAGTDTWAPPAIPADNQWMTASNWGGIAPTSGNDVLTFAGASNTTANNNFSSGIFGGLNFASGASSFSLTGNAINLTYVDTSTASTASSGDIINNSSAAENINLSAITLDMGAHFFSPASGQLNITSNINVDKAAVAIFLPGAGTVNFTGSALTNDASGILGGWATFGGNNYVPGGYAALDANGNVVAYTGYNTIAGNGALIDDPTKNFSITSNATGVGATTAALPAAVTHVNTILLASTPANTVTQIIAVGAGNTLVLGQNGGVMDATNSAGNTLRALTIGASVATGGTLTAGDGINPANINITGDVIPTTTTDITINSRITDNATVNSAAPAPVSVTISGGYMSLSNSTNSYTGGTYVLSGRINTVVTGALSTGPVYILPGGIINTSGTFANNFFISGNGSLEQPPLGLGALRLFGTGAAAGNIEGTVTLLGDAEITATNTSVPLITGQITGTGNLTLNRTNGSQAGGTINIGSNTAAPGIPNNYTGDTILSAPTAGTGNGGLEIIAPLTIGANDNIMPHGLTGSYLGGATGNLILDASASGHNAIFDLNGTTQTINGLSSTNTMPSSDIITSSGGTTGNVATLVIGDSNASGTYYGSIQDGGGQLAIRKIGSGTETFATASANPGTISYTGDTNINGGTLVATNGLSSSGNVNINTTSASTTFIASGTVGNITLAANNGSFKANLSPGASASIGSIAALTASSLTVNGGNLNFDLSSTPGTGDTLNVNGLVTFNAAATFNIHGGATGTYTLLNSFGGPIVYGAGVSLVTPTADPLVRPTVYTLDTLSNPNAINVNVTGGPASLIWSGSAGAAWAINTPATKNFTSTGPDVFYNQDSVTFGDSGANRTIAISGSVQPASVNVIADAGTDYTFSGGTIDGVTALNKSNGGNLTLTSNNSYSGGTNINAGTVTVGNNTNAGSLGSGNITFTNPATLVFSRSDAVSIPNIISGPGNLIIGQPGGGGGTSNVTLTAVNAYSGNTTVSNGSTLVIAASGSIIGNAGVFLNNSTEIINGANASADFGNALTIGSGGATVKYGALTSTGSFGTNNIPITTTAGTFTIDLNDASDSAKTFAFASTITGPADILLTDSLGNAAIENGNLDSFTSSVTFAGATGNLTVSNGIRATLPGIPAGSVTITSGAELLLNAAGSFPNNFSLSGPGASSDVPALGALRLSSGTTLTGNIALTASSTITVGTTATNTAILNGQISGPGALTLASGTFTLADLTASPNSYGPTAPGSIATIIGNLGGRAGNVTVNDPNSISHAGLQLQDGNLIINGFDISFANLSSTLPPGTNVNGGSISNGGSTTNTLSFGSDNTSQSFAGVIADGTTGGFLNVSKNGTGTETFSGNQTYSGTTTINAGGTLAISPTGSLSTTTNVIANGNLNFANPAQSLASLNGTGAVNLTATALTLNGSGVAGPVNDGGSNASLIIAGTQSLTKVSVGTLTINSGTGSVAALVIANNTSSPAVSKVNALSLAGSYGGSASAASTWTAALDLTNSKLIVEDSSPNRAADIAQLQNEALASNTASNTVGIYSSTAAAFNTAAGKIVKVVAVVDNNVRMATFPSGSTNFGGVNNVDANSILITAAFKGDANLDGVVDIQDLTVVANHWQQAVTDWSQGDFDGSDFVDIQDLTAVANNWQAGVGSGGGSSFSEALSELPGFGKTAATPEPASLALLTLGGLLLTTRRRIKK